MEDLRELYQEVILDHNKNPRNYFKMDDASHMAEGRNPLCGDHFTVYLMIEDNVVRAVSFQGSGCAISRASASIMSTILKGKTKEQAEHLFQLFQKVVKGEINSSAHLEELGKLAAFAGVAEFPVRVKCATLAWHTFSAALHGGQESVSTE